MILATISVIITTAKSGETVLILFVAFEKYLFNRIPIRTGSKTTFTVSKNRPQGFTLRREPTKKEVNVGVIIAAKTVEIDVIVTDSAKFTFARKLMTLDAVPPGQQDTRIKPTVKWRGRLNSFPRK